MITESGQEARITSSVPVADPLEKVANLALIKLRQCRILFHEIRVESR
jgi:hypothetical protein